MFEQIVVTEGKFDRELLEKVLPGEIAAKTLIVEGMGPSSALSLARSYYAQGKRVLIVLDSNTVDEESILERKAFVESALQMLGSGAEAKVILGVPGLDALLFTDKDFIEGYFSKKAEAADKSVNFICSSSKRLNLKSNEIAEVSISSVEELKSHDINNVRKRENKRNRLIFFYIFTY